MYLFGLLFFLQAKSAYANEEAGEDNSVQILWAFLILAQFFCVFFYSRSVCCSASAPRLLNETEEVDEIEKMDLLRERKLRFEM